MIVVKQHQETQVRKHACIEPFDGSKVMRIVMIVFGLSSCGFRFEVKAQTPSTGTSSVQTLEEIQVLTVFDSWQAYMP